MPVQLFGITPAKLGPALWIMAEPLAKLRARGNVFHPSIDHGIRFLKTTRPEPIDQHAHSIFRRNAIIDTLQLNVDGWNRMDSHRILLCAKAASCLGQGVIAVCKHREKSVDAACRRAAITNCPNGKRWPAGKVSGC